MIPTAPILFWEYADVAISSIFIPLIVILVAHYYKLTGKTLGTISETVAHSDRSSLIFSVVMTMIFPLYYAFIWFWVGPLTNMPTWFYYILVFSAVCETVFVWVPHKPGTKGTAHKITAYAVGVVMFTAPILILLFGSNLSDAVAASIIIFITTSLILGSLLFPKGLRRHTFVYESLFCVAFIGVMSIIAHG